jgi:hypothetical protein
MMFILVSYAYLLPPDCGAAQPVIDRFAEAVIRHGHNGDGARAFVIERAKITEKIGGGFTEIALGGQIHDRGGGAYSRHRNGTERQQRLTGLDVIDV